MIRDRYSLTVLTAYSITVFGKQNQGAETIFQPTYNTKKTYPTRLAEKY